jgi:PAS domain S-box-containing protein
VKATSPDKRLIVAEWVTNHRASLSFLIVIILLVSFLILGFFVPNLLLPLLAISSAIIVGLLSQVITSIFPSSNPASLYEALFTQTYDAVFIMDMKGFLFKANQLTADLFGYTVDELLSMNFRQLIDPSELQDVEEKFAKLVSGEKIPIFERSYITKSGEKVLVEVNVQVIKDVHARPQHIQCVIRDIRNRKQSENIHKYTQDLLRTLISAIPDRAVILDKRGVYRAVLNSADLHPWISGSEIVGKHVSHITTPQFGDFCVSMIEKTLVANSLQIFEYDYDDGKTVRSFDGRTIPFYDQQADETLVFWVAHDITERKAAARVLFESERRLRALTNGLPDRAIILDADGYYHDILTEHVEELPDVLLNVKGKHLRDILEPVYVDFCLAKVRETLEKNTPLAFDYEIEAGGVHFYLDGRTIPSSDVRTGEPVVIWVSRDISRLKETEQALKHHNHLYSLLTELAIEFVNLPIEDLDAGITKMLARVGEFIEADRSYINTYSDDLTKAAVAYEWYAPKIQAISEGNIYKDVSKLRWSTEQFVRHETVSIPSVEKLPLEAQYEKENLLLSGIKSVLAIPLINDGKFIGTLGFHAIQSEKAWAETTRGLLNFVGEIYVNALRRKEAEEALFDSEKRMRLFVGSLPDRAVIFDRKGYYYEILKRDFDTLNLPEETKQIQAGTTLADFYSPDFVAFCLNKINDSLDSNRSLAFEYTSPVRGDNYRMEARIIPFRDPLTKEERVFWVTRDISERVQAEQQRTQLMLAREKVDFMRQFVDSITHDLKTPITVIGTSLHLIEHSQDPAKRQERMITIRKQLATLTHMIDELLAVARLDEMPKMQFVSTDFYDILHDVVDFLAPKAELKQITLSLNLAGTAPKILASYDELSRAISNLIDNAIKYTPSKGSVNLSVSLEATELVFAVQDTGIGISAEDIQRIFERFFRADTARKEAPGTGLGLEISRRIIELHGGKISLESELNRGTTFRVWLPLEIDEASQLEIKQ